MIPIGEISEMATSIIHPRLQGARSSVQPLAAPAPIPPKFIPPSLDPNWTRLTQARKEKEIALVLSRSRRDDGYSTILDPDTILVSSYSPSHKNTKVHMPFVSL